jgi:AcrR family transcriptional regulator
MDEKLKSILERTAEMFISLGVKRVSMDDIASELQVSKKTLYKYVSDKTDLVQQTFLFKFEEKRREIDELVSKSSNAIEEVLMIFEMILTMTRNFNPSLEYDLKKYYKNLSEQFINHRIQHTYVVTKKNLERGINEGIYRPEIDPETIAKQHALSLTGNFNKVQNLFKDFDCAEAIKERIFYHLHGICNEKGLQILKDLTNNQQ